MDYFYFQTFTEEGGPGSLKNLNGRPKTRGVSRGTDSTQDEQVKPFSSSTGLVRKLSVTCIRR